MELKKRMALRMKELGLTQVQLARRSGLTQQAISQYIRGQFKPGYDTIVTLSKALDVHPAWFFEAEVQHNLPSQDEPSPRMVAANPVPNPRSTDIVVFPLRGKIPRNKTFVIGHWWPVVDFPPPNLVRSRGIVGNFYELIFNKLAEPLPSGQLRGALAVNWKPIKNSWVFQLREGVRFHDGRPLTVDDVVWSYQQHLQLNPQEHLIEGVETLDKSFIQIHVKSPCRLEEIAGPFILPRGTAAMSDDWSGTGPFQLIELNSDFWRLRRNPDYFLGNPYFDELHIRQYPDASALKEALVDGDVHFAIQLYAPGENFVTKAEPAALRYHLHFKLNQPLAQNLALRQAIALALDREALAKAAGLTEPIYSSGPFDLFLDDRWHTPPPPYPEAAKQLLKQVPNLKDSKFQLGYSQKEPNSRLVVEAIVEQLNEIGIPTIPVLIGKYPYEDARLLTRPIDLEREYMMWKTSAPHNLNDYSNPQVDKLIAHYGKISVMPPQLLQLRRLIQRDLPDIPLFYYETPVTYVKQLRALEDRVVLMSCFTEIHTWYLEEGLEVRRQEEEAEKAQIASSA